MTLLNVQSVRTFSVISLRDTHPVDYQNPARCRQSTETPPTFRIFPESENLSEFC